MSSTKQKISEGWLVVSMPSISEVIMGQSPPGSTYNDKGEGLPFFQGKTEFGDIYPQEKKWCTQPNKIAEPGDILLSIRAPVGPTNVADKKCAIGRGLTAIRPLCNIPTEYILYSLRFHEQKIATWGTGSTFSAISRKHIDEIMLDLPPLAEQKRIADVAGRLFMRVRNVKQQLDNAAETMKRFRKSVLNAACTGKLTEEWRDGKKTEDWLSVSVKDVTTKIQYGYTASSDAKIKGPRFLRITDIQKGKVNWDKVPSCQISKDQITKFQLQIGDILFVRTGATTGKSFLIKDHPLSVFASYLIRVKPDKQKVTPEFLYLFFRSDAYWEQIAGKVSGSAQPNCNATKLSHLELDLPSLIEQSVIADRVERLFELADKIEDRITQARDRVEKLTQSILAKAFRGELVPTEAELARIEDREYETAEQLLERINVEQMKNKAAKTKKKKSNIKEKSFEDIFMPKENLLEIISKSKDGIKPEDLLDASCFTVDTIEEFYEELARLEKAGKIEDYRPHDRLSLLREIKK